MACVEEVLKDHLASISLLWAGSPTTRPGRPEPHPAWPLEPVLIAYKTFGTADKIVRVGQHTFSSLKQLEL